MMTQTDRCEVLEENEMYDPNTRIMEKKNKHGETVLWGGLKNPAIRDGVRKGLMSPSSKDMAKEGELYYKKYLGEMETLIHYFGEDWFDLHGDWRQSIKDGRDDRKYSNAQPSRCGKCKKPWDVEPSSGFYYIESKSFTRLPMKAMDCPNCS